MTEQHQEETKQSTNKLIAERRAKLTELRGKGPVFPNDFRRDSLAQSLQEQFADKDKASLEELAYHAAVAGRIMAKRGPFLVLQDGSGQIQLYVDRKNLAPELLESIKDWDIGDIVGARGTVQRSGKGDLYVKIEQAELLTKSLRPLPEKYHGISDQEMRYRQRYVDLIMSEKSRRTFRIRSAIINYIRRFMNERGYLEVETPMLQIIPGGATARPFITHHNALGQDMYLRIAQELNIKRLLVGGFEKVFEMNRIFRNEGLSTRHNPEFTMMEWNEAYADYVDYMDMTEEMLRGMAEEVLGTTTIHYQGNEYDFGAPFQRLTMFDAVLQYNPDISAEQLSDLASARQIAERLDIDVGDNDGPGKILMEIFDVTVEEKLKNPTFITAYPTEVSPLSRRNDKNPDITDRFELYIGGRELVNGFSELNDPEDQADRFHEQVAQKEAGDHEAMYFDHDYIRALEYGLPPNAGGGIGIDRLVMLFTDSASIRDVLLFPHMRPEAGES